MKKRKLFHLFLIMLLLIVIVTIIFSILKNLNVKIEEDISSQLPSVSDEEIDENEKKDVITREQMLEDFNFMVTTIEENSPFWGVMERRNLISTWERLKIQYSEEISTSDFDIMLFHSRLQRFLSNFRIGHLDVMTSEMYRIIYSFILESPHSVSFNNAWKDALLYDKSTDFYSRLKKGKKKSTEINTMASDELEKQDDTYFSPYKTEILEEGKTALLQIDSFMYPPNEEQKQELFDFYRSIGNYENLIIDITKNKGGNTTYWEESIVLPNLKETVTYSDYMLYRDTPLIQKYYSELIMECKIDKREVKPLFIEANASDYDFLDIAIKAQSSLSPLFEKPLFNGRIWVTPSELNTSSTESFVRFCKKTGFATLVGRRTRGSSSGGSSLFFPLPNSGIMVRFDAVYFLNPDGTNQFETGTEPDYIVDGDSLKECLRMIENEGLSDN